MSYYVILTSLPNTTLVTIQCVQGLGAMIWYMFLFLGQLGSHTFRTKAKCKKRLKKKNKKKSRFDKFWSRTQASCHCNLQQFLILLVQATHFIKNVSGSLNRTICSVCKLNGGVSGNDWIIIWNHLCYLLLFETTSG